MRNIGIVHPGEMGISIAAAAKHGGNAVLWVSEGRSPETARRAQQHALTDCGTLRALCARCDVVLSVCPPDAAEAQAQAVLGAGFAGVYVDANAISPMRAQRIGALCATRGVVFVDGGIIGGPAWKPGTTWLMLSGAGAGAIAGLFAGSPLETQVLDDTVGSASALKMAYAALTKGTAALLAAVFGAADAHGVRAALEAQWERDTAGASAKHAQRVTGISPKAWRWAGEMHEIADTFAAAGMPDGFHRAAADVFARMAGFKGRPAGDVAEVIATLRP